jgi:UDP-N-acetylglucosamine acyltransferase
MHNGVHGSAIVHEGARLGDEVTVGPWSIIGPHASIGDGTVVGSNVLIDGHTSIGRRNRIFHGAALGSAPQDLKYRGEKSYTRIGDDNTIREYVTINAATGEGDATVVGSNCLLMAYVHIAHDCVIGDNVILANAVNLAGHVVIDEYAILGGIVPVHQFTRIGAHSFTGGGSRIAKDVPPYTKVVGNPPRVCGLNSIGLQRRGYGAERLAPLRRAYRLLFRGGFNVSQALERIEQEIEPTPEIEVLLRFIRESQRGIIL